jgi:hypothetical protein
MVATHGTTATGGVAFTAGGGTTSRPRRQLMIAEHAPKPSVKSGVLVVAAAVMWLIVIAILTVV